MQRGGLDVEYNEMQHVMRRIMQRERQNVIWDAVWNVSWSMDCEMQRVIHDAWCSVLLNWKLQIKAGNYPNIKENRMKKDRRNIQRRWEVAVIYVQTRWFCVSLLCHTQTHTDRHTHTHTQIHTHTHTHLLLSWVWNPTILESRLAYSQKLLFVHNAECKLSLDSSLQSCFLFPVFLFHVNNIYSLEARARELIFRIILPLSGGPLSRRDGWHFQRTFKPFADGFCCS